MTPGLWHYLLELLVFMSLAYFLGCILGAAWHTLASTSTATLPQQVEQPSAETVVKETQTAPLVAEHSRMIRPRGLDAPRGGKPDDLQRISGVGPKNEKVLHSLGFYHFDQIAAWTQEQINWVDDHLSFNGRIVREEWINQCRLLASGSEEEFSRLYGTGGQHSVDGGTRSGSRTRRS